jgi:aspartyl-tRNA(Asn)/glutamyl-tRNA(Gln) amidotransferase subunit B
MPGLRDRNLDLCTTRLTPERFSGLLALLDNEKINVAAAKEILFQMLEKDGSPEELTAAAGLEQVSDEAALVALADGIIADHPSDAADFKNGNPNVVGFLMGLAMKASKGKANPKQMKEILTRQLNSL